MSVDSEAQLCERVAKAVSDQESLCLHGGNTKAFYGRTVKGTPLDLTAHCGVISYEPTELVLTARGGTSLREIEQVLQDNGQMLPFEPPRFGAESTLGGAVASGLAGPQRPWFGAPRDLVLGIKLLDGKGQVLKFGGQVMKNVAGYDLSRLMAGALGTLGILLEISIKVLPQPVAERALVLERERDAAVKQMRKLSALPAPLTGAVYLDGLLRLRLAGNATGVADWAGRIGGDTDDSAFWLDLRDHRLPYFDGDLPLWRLSLAPATPPLSCETDSLVDWAGAQRWVRSQLAGATIRSEVEQTGGHAVLFRNGSKNGDVFHPLDPLRARLHADLKQTFDPNGIFNPGRMYAQW